MLLVPIAIVGCSRASSSVAPSHSTPNGIVLVTSVPSASPSGTPSSAQVETYLTVATSADTAYLVWNSALAGASRPSHLVSPAATYVQALTTFDSTITTFYATGKTGTDISTLVTDNTTVIADLNSVGSQTAGTYAIWKNNLQGLGLNAIAAGDAVRADLGLPAS